MRFPKIIPYKELLVKRHLEHVAASTTSTASLRMMRSRTGISIPMKPRKYRLAPIKNRCQPIFVA